MSEEFAGRSQRLVEIIALVAIVGALAILAVLYLDRSTGTPARRTTCANNMRNVALAIIQYENTHKEFPGFANTVGSRTASYVVPIFPILERKDLLNAWEGDTVPFEELAALNLEILTCPSDLTAVETPGPLSYVVNAGEALRESAANGIFHDHTKPNAVTVSIDYVAQHDGTSFTLLVSENLQAERWAVTHAHRAKLWTTFVWHRNLIPRNGRINAGKDAQQPIGSLEYARPSSNHTGGVNVMFCGGNSRFIVDNIDYKVYRQLMTPNSAESDDPAAAEIHEDSL